MTPPTDPELWTKEDIIESFEQYTRHDFINVLQVLNSEVALQSSAAFIRDVVLKAPTFGNSLSQKQFVATKKVAVKYAQSLANIKNERLRAERSPRYAAPAHHSPAPPIGRKLADDLQPLGMWLKHRSPQGEISFSADASELRLGKNSALVEHPFKPNETFDVSRMAEETDQDGDVTHWWIDERFEHQLVRITVYND